MPAEGPIGKPWRDNATIWQPGRESFQYYVWDGEVELKTRTRIGDAGTPVTDVENIGLLVGYGWYAVKFYNERALKGDKNFSRVPRLVLVNVTAAEAKRLNILNPPTTINVQWPLAVPHETEGSSTIPVKVAMRFGPDGLPQAFNVDEYDKEFPIEMGALSDQELVDAVKSIVSMPDAIMSVPAKASAIRRAAK
jgi:hypothetical protein